MKSSVKLSIGLFAILGETEEEGEILGLTELLGLILGDSDGLMDGETDVDGEREGDSEGEILGETDVDGERLGDSEGETDGDADVDGEIDGDAEGLFEFEGLKEGDSDGLMLELPTDAETLILSILKLFPVTFPAPKPTIDPVLQVASVSSLLRTSST